MMAVQQLVKCILSRNPEVTEEEIMRRLEKERRKTNGLISDETLLRIVAAGLGVEIQKERTSTPALLVAGLLPSFNDVTVIGRVTAVFSTKTFEGNRSGRLASFLMADKSGMLRVVLWNSKVDLLESQHVKVGQIVRVSHGYTKEGYGGETELHVGEKCEIEVDPKEVDAKQFPTISSFITKASKLAQVRRNEKVNVTGRVKKLTSQSAFQRQDSSQGKVMRFVLADETGDISVVVWNEKVDELEKLLDKGAELQIVNARAKKPAGQDLEIHVDSGSYLAEYQPTEEKLRIAELKEGLFHVNIEGEVASKPIVRDVKTSKQELVRLASFELKDESGKIWISAWRKHANVVSELKVGHRVGIKNACMKKSFNDQLEISTRDSTIINIISEKNGIDRQRAL